MIIIVEFSHNSYYDNFDKEYMLLNNLENSFNTNTYNKNFSSTNTTIKIIKNDIQEDFISVKEINYEDNNIKLTKYEMQ